MGAGWDLLLIQALRACAWRLEERGTALRRQPAQSCLDCTLLLRLLTYFDKLCAHCSAYPLGKTDLRKQTQSDSQPECVSVRKMTLILHKRKFRTECIQFRKQHSCMDRHGWSQTFCPYVAVLRLLTESDQTRARVTEYSFVQVSPNGLAAGRLWLLGAVAAGYIICKYLIVICCIRTYL